MQVTHGIVTAVQIFSTIYEMYEMYEIYKLNFFDESRLLV